MNLYLIIFLIIFGVTSAYDKQYAWNSGSYGVKTFSNKFYGGDGGNVFESFEPDSDKALRLLQRQSKIPPLGTCLIGYKVPMNSDVKCETEKCSVKCIEGFEFPDHRTELTLMCIFGRWVVQETAKYKIIPDCQAICSPPCQNNGICVSPNLCQCGENYDGPNCENKISYCKSRISTVNALTSCSGTAVIGYRKCSVQCNRGYLINGKVEKADLKCLNGKTWIREDGSSMEAFNDKCSPVCDIPCQNGGTCVGPNVCSCREKYAGLACQYEKSVCNITVIAGFNGGYACSYTSEYYNCTLNCPKGIEFTSKPAGSYTCRFSEGKFYPEPVPKCNYPKKYSITSSSYTSHQGSDNQNWRSISSGYSESKGGGSYGVGGSLSGSISYGKHQGGYGGFDSGKYTQNQINQQEIDGGYSFGTGGGSYSFGIGGNTGQKNYGAESVGQASGTLIEREKSIHDYYIFGNSGVYSFSMLKLTGIQKVPSLGLCLVWNGMNVKTFDGAVFQSRLLCSHTMIEDRIDGTFKVVLRTCQTTEYYDCPYALIIYWNDSEYKIENKDGHVILSTPQNKTIPTPVKFLGMDVSYEGRYLMVNLETVGLKILWDKKNFISFEANKKLLNRTQGLCGTFDGDVRNDFAASNGVTLKTPRSFVDTWSVYYPEEKNCDETNQINFDISTYEIGIKLQAEQFVKKLFNNFKLDESFRVINKTAAFEFAIRDYYNCPNVKDRSVCACETLSMLVAQSSFEGAKVSEEWRDLSICPIKCSNGRFYNQCGPSVENTCGSVQTDIKAKCVEGCFCPEGTVLHNNVCIQKSQCPCSQGGKEFPNGATIKKNCNTCTCKLGLWKCTENICGARCISYGSSHYITFDGQEYDFIGKCSYILLKSGKLIIEIEKDLNTKTFKNLPFTKSLSIKYVFDDKNQVHLKLKLGKVVLKDGREISKLPLVIADNEIVVRFASSKFLTVEFANGIRVFWDGQSRAYIDAPPAARNNTGGLCGAFNLNTKLDFLTPEGDYETAVKPFVDKWRTVDSCPAIVNSQIELHPCKENPHLKEKAAKYCTHLTGKLFQDCHWSVSPNQFYENCMFDVCACSETKLSECYCPILTAYSDECSRQGIKIDIQKALPECGFECPIGQIYEKYGSSCTRSCLDLSIGRKCYNETYIEGCRCPAGQLLNDNNECIPQDKCPCFFDDLTFESGYKGIRPGKNVMDLCSCNRGSWSCSSAKDQDIKLYPSMRGNCKKPNTEFSKCVPAEIKTCYNMQDFKENLEGCQSGCVCVKGYVFDRSRNECVLPEKCSCHHSGTSYGEGQIIDEECSKCKCENGKWKCTQKPCEAVCSVWGDSHFNTFDGLSFDFQGVCDYYLSKGTDSNGNGFSISIQNVLCGSLGVTCSKSLTVSLSGYTTETITLSSDTPLARHQIYKPNEKNSLIIYKSGVFQVIEDSYIGIQVKWDFGTRVYVKLNNKWQGKVKGLCGDYNHDALNDMVTPSGAKETRSTFFGHSWVAKDSCLVPSEPINACKEHPLRETWAQMKCGILKSDIFKPCHGEISYNKYLDKCIFDTCACDQGGDCECLCTAISSYAYACSQRGIDIKWRKRNFCPMQCDSECSSYSACVSPCPIETCENLLDQGTSNLMCEQEKCSEGCQIKPCKEGYIHSNDSYLECVPKAKCAPVCIEMDGKKYYEGDIVSSNDCQTCRCTKNKITCSGEPCEEMEQPCADGWSKWINEDEFVLASVSKKIPKPEMITTQPLTYGICEKEFMTKIECLTVGSHKTPYEMGDKCSCDLQNGFKCKGTVKNDYEIRVLCQCTKDHETEKKIPKECDAAIKEYKEYPDDCHKFYHCTPQIDGNYGYAEKTCGSSMMFNPTNNICDHIAIVKQIKPTCGEITQKPPYAKLETTTQGTLGRFEEKTTGKTYVPEEKTTGRTYVTEGKTTGRTYVTEGKTTGRPYVTDEKTTGRTYVTEGKTTSRTYVTEGKTTGRTYVTEKRTTKSPYITSITKTPLIPLGGNCNIENKQYSEYIGDCQKFLQCTIQSDRTWEYVEKTCGPGTYFNPLMNNCDHIENVIKIKPECGETVKPPVSSDLNYLIPETPDSFDEKEKCSPGMKWISCANFCRKSCHYYRNVLIKNGKCRPQERCRPGCVEESIPDCAATGNFWRDEYKCVDVDNCPCMNLDETLVKPHQTHIESTDQSKACQCLDNHYVCKEIYEAENITDITNQITGEDVLQYEVRLPKGIRVKPFFPKQRINCTSKIYVPIINSFTNPLPDKIFTASSIKSEKHLPNYARFDSKYAWSPSTNDETEYIQIEFPHIEKVFAILMQGSPIADEYVNSYQVVYSKDGEDFYTINDKNGKQQIFSGPVDSENPVKTVLKYPIEAKIIRIYPLKWTGDISMQIEFFGCDMTQKLIATTTSTTAEKYHKTEQTPLAKEYYRTEPTVTHLIDKTTTDKYHSTKSKVTMKFETTVSKPHHAKTVTEKYKKTTTKPYHSTKTAFTKEGETTTWLPVRLTPPQNLYDMTYPPMVPFDRYIVPTTMISYITTEAPNEPICAEYMGVYDDSMRPEQVKVSSKYSTGIKTKHPSTIELLKFNSTFGWRPAINLQNEYVQFDFLEPRLLTGLLTYGGVNGWVTAYNVLYSNDGRTWNNVQDLQGAKIFVGNQNSVLPKENIFYQPIKAQYLKIHPHKWYNNIVMKIEPLGCFEPYPVITTIAPAVPEKLILSNCSICDGTIDNELSLSICNCKYPKFWNGKSCVPQIECPCIDNHVSYPIGAKFETRDCEECICVLGGIKQCQPKKCPPCEIGLRPVKKQTCLCLCEECPKDTRICPSSGDCIKNSEWCDGIKNCEDDENYECYQTTEYPTSIEPYSARKYCSWEGILYGPNEEWKSLDKCTSYKCVQINNEYVIESDTITCKPIDCHISLAYKDGCCLKCKKLTPQIEENCAAVPINGLDTIKMVAHYDKVHSLCINKEPIPDFTQCNGHCASGTKFNKITSKQQPYCDCCKMQSSKFISVQLLCEDGYRMTKEIEVPVKCECNICKDSNRVNRSELTEQDIK